jgi:predicted O-methyltransferase YrrM
MNRIIFELMSAVFPYNFNIGIPRRGFLSKERHRMLEQAFMYTHDERIPGNYVEFGTARGTSLIYAYEVCRKHRFNDVRFFGFDSFQGFPEPKGVDRVFERFKQGEVAFPRRIAERNLWLYGADRRRVELIEGWYADTLAEAAGHHERIGTARVVNIDCDLHDSALAALRFIARHLVTGSIILFDDWLCYRADPTKGEQAAVRRWLDEQPQLSLVPFRSYANVGQSFIVHVRASLKAQGSRLEGVTSSLQPPTPSF